MLSDGHCLLNGDSLDVGAELKMLFIVHWSMDVYAGVDGWIVLNRRLLQPVTKECYFSDTLHSTR